MDRYLIIATKSTASAVLNIVFIVLGGLFLIPGFALIGTIDDIGMLFLIPLFFGVVFVLVGVIGHFALKKQPKERIIFDRETRNLIINLNNNVLNINIFEIEKVYARSRTRHRAARLCIVPKINTMAMQTIGAKKLNIEHIADLHNVANKIKNLISTGGNWEN